MNFVLIYFYLFNKFCKKMLLIKNKKNKNKKLLILFMDSQNTFLRIKSRSFYFKYK